MHTLVPRKPIHHSDISLISYFGWKIYEGKEERGGGAPPLFLHQETVLQISIVLCHRNCQDPDLYPWEYLGTYIFYLE